MGRFSERALARRGGLQRYLRELRHWAGVAGAVDFFHIKRHYSASHWRINPTGVAPLGPEMEL